MTKTAQSNTQLKPIDLDVEVAEDDTGSLTMALPVDMKQVKQLSNFVRTNFAQIQAAQDDMERLVLTSAYINGLRQALTDDMMRVIMPLQNSKLGFTTDKGHEKPPGEYSVDEVRTVTIAAFMNGFQMVNDEVTIIRGAFYGGKKGFWRLINQHPRVRKFKFLVGEPDIDKSNGIARMDGVAKWEYDGEPDELKMEGRFCIITSYNGSSDKVDTIKGRGESKLWRQAWKQISGMDVATCDDGWDGEDQPGMATATVDGEVQGITSESASGDEQTELPLDDKPTVDGGLTHEECKDIYVSTADSLDERLGKADKLNNVNNIEKSELATVEAIEGAHDEFRIQLDSLIKEACEARRERIRGDRGYGKNADKGEVK